MDIKLKKDIIIDSTAIIKNIDRITNQIFKLLPNREENKDWQNPLNNLIVEIGGMSFLLEDHYNLFSLLCKLQGLNNLTDKEDFFQFRKTIFECLGICGEIKNVFREYEKKN